SRLRKTAPRADRARGGEEAVLLRATVERHLLDSEPAAADAGRASARAALENVSAAHRRFSSAGDVSLLPADAQRATGNADAPRTQRAGIHLRARRRAGADDLRRQ